MVTLPVHVLLCGPSVNLKNKKREIKKTNVEKREN